MVGLDVAPPVAVRLHTADLARLRDQYTSSDRNVDRSTCSLAGAGLFEVGPAPLLRVVLLRVAAPVRSFGLVGVLLAPLAHPLAGFLAESFGKIGVFHRFLTAAAVRGHDPCELALAVLRIGAKPSCSLALVLASFVGINVR